MMSWRMLVSGLVIIHLPLVAWAQQGRTYTEISGSGQSLYRIAVPAPLGSAVGKQVQQILSNDLSLYGLFKVLDPRGFLANAQAEGMGLTPKSWIDVGAQSVVKMKLTRSGSQLTAQWLLYDVAKGASPVLRKKTGAPSARKLAHRIGDEIVRYLTGDRGLFTTRIAFAAGSRRGSAWQIYTMDYDGSGVRRLTRTGKQNVLPAWSPTGKIAYTSFLWRNPDLYVVSSGGGRAKRISKRAGLNTGAAWSPRGDHIAVTLSKDGNSEIYVLNAQGAIVRRVTRHPGIDSQPSWSPDGRQLTFVSDRGGTPQIYVVSAAGGSPRRLTFSGKYNQEPDWCPRADAPLIAFTGRDERGAYDIFTVHAKTGEVKRLTQGQGSNKSPSWAPNGRLVVFTSSRGGLWLMTPEGHNQRQIYRGGAETPAWSGF